MSDVVIPISRRIKDEVPVPDLSDLASLSAETMMTLLEDSLSGNFGIRCQIFDTYADLEIGAVNEGRLYYCKEDETYYGYTPSKGLKVIG